MVLVSTSHWAIRSSIVIVLTLTSQWKDHCTGRGGHCDTIDGLLDHSEVDARTIEYLHDQ